MAINFTNLLFIMLLLAAVLGVVIGAALWRIKTSRAQARADQHHRTAIEKIRDQLADVEDRHAALQRVADAEKRLLSSAKNKEEYASAQQDALQVHSRLQAQRIASLEASLSSAEDRGLRMQRDFESYKMHKQNELEMSRRASTLDHLNEPADNDLPVLNKRVTSHDTNAARVAASVQAIQAMLEKELDLPMLDESELTGSIDDIEFEAEADGANPVG